MSDTRPSFFDFDATKMFADFPFRPFDVEAVWAAGRRNVEAWSKANRLAVEGAQAMAKRQAEMARQSFDDFSGLMRDLSQPGSAEERIAKHTEFTKNAIEKSVTYGREIATLATKSGADAAEVLNKRASEGLDEICAMSCQKAKTAA
ncbi:MAG TPA: phasin family protein [Stellaceae bacterium]|nr:phasin family protein [Stellaceae bacterium]